jgi:hypothetical protein
MPTRTPRWCRCQCPHSMLRLRLLRYTRFLAGNTRPRHERIPRQRGSTLRHYCHTSFSTDNPRRPRLRHPHDGCDGGDLRRLLLPYGGRDGGSLGGIGAGEGSDRETTPARPRGTGALRLPKSATRSVALGHPTHLGRSPASHRLTQRSQGASAPGAGTWSRWLTPELPGRARVLTHSLCVGAPAFFSFLPHSSGQIHRQFTAARLDRWREQLSRGCGRSGRRK